MEKVIDGGATVPPTAHSEIEQERVPTVAERLDNGNAGAPDTSTSSQDEPHAAAQRTLWIATGEGHLGKICQQQMTWPEYIEWLRKHYAVLPVTRAQYAELDSDKKAALKKNLAFSLGAKYRGTARKGADIELRELLNIDLDKLEPAVYEAVLAAARRLGCTCLHVGSPSNEVNELRSGRLIIPLSRSVEPTIEFPAISRKIAEKLDIEAVDPVSHEKNQICYVPARCSDASLVFKVFP
jgi:hypothetical protein